jgi:hypothetical protein
VNVDSSATGTYQDPLKNSPSLRTHRFYNPASIIYSLPYGYCIYRYVNISVSLKEISQMHYVNQYWLRKHDVFMFATTATTAEFPEHSRQ